MARVVRFHKTEGRRFCDSRVHEFCVSDPVEADMRNGQFFRKESTMAQLEQVMYTATAHSTRGWDDASVHINID